MQLGARAAPLSVRIVHLCDDFKTAEFLTADFADIADKGMRFSDYPVRLRSGLPRQARDLELVETAEPVEWPRHLRNLRRRIQGGRIHKINRRDTCLRRAFGRQAETQRSE